MQSLTKFYDYKKKKSVKLLTEQKNSLISMSFNIKMHLINIRREEAINTMNRISLRLHSIMSGQEFLSINK